MSTLFSTAYWPSLHYFFYALKVDEIVIDFHSHYQKQTYANRCRILSANGPLTLSVPVHKTQHHCAAGDIKISYQERWPQVHWGALQSAYKKSPYFDFFETEIYDLYRQQFDTLIEFNTSQLQLLLRLLRLNKKISYTSGFKEPGTSPEDTRSLIHPKRSFLKDEAVSGLLARAYYQTFSDKHGFCPDLSILDLLFNKGLESVDYLLPANDG